MDILCKRCGEPWDSYGATSGSDMTRWEYQRMKKGEGCPCCAGKEPCQLEVDCDFCEHYDRYKCLDKKFKPINQHGREAMGVLSEILGDDVDGIAATLEDFGLA